MELRGLEQTAWEHGRFDAWACRLQRVALGFTGANAGCNWTRMDLRGVVQAAWGRGWISASVCSVQSGVFFRLWA
jgi:hypothetical protein